jgi:flagellar basal-body rod protein FlgG
MVYGIYQSAAGLQTSQYRQGVLANNLANVGTTGFKRDLAVIRERRIESAEELHARDTSDEALRGMTGGSLVAPTFTTFDQGALETTGRPLDVALDGIGFFVVENGNEEAYTRDGRFTRNEAGELVTVAGNKRLLDESGQPILIPGDASRSVSIDASGRVHAGAQVFGRIQSVTFDEPRNLVKIGGNLFKAFDAQPADRRTRVHTRTIENSNVDPTSTMVNLMQVARAYEMNATLVGLADSTLNRAVNDIARIG